MNPTDEFVIIGAGGHGRELLDIVDALDIRHLFRGFVDDSALSAEATNRIARRRAEVVGTVDWLTSTELRFVIGIGTSSARRSIAARFADGSTGAAGVGLVHPTASLGSELRLGEGVVIGAHSVITTNVSIGAHSHINVGCAVQHDSTIGHFVTVSPGVFINGDVTIGDDVFIGTSAAVTRGCTVGAGAVIGAGAIVLDDVAPGASVYGVPARPRSA